jgi:hypothetical protein
VLGDGGLACEACARPGGDALAISPATIGAFERLRSVSWDEAFALPLDRIEAELSALLESQVARLIGHPTRSTKFQRELRRLSPISEGHAIAGEANLYP